MLLEAQKHFHYSHSRTNITLCYVVLDLFEESSTNFALSSCYTVELLKVSFLQIKRGLGFSFYMLSVHLSKSGPF